jgi:hypothetical protein
VRRVGGDGAGDGGGGGARREAVAELGGDLCFENKWRSLKESQKRVIVRESGSSAVTCASETETEAETRRKNASERLVVKKSLGGDLGGAGGGGAVLRGDEARREALHGRRVGRVRRLLSSGGARGGGAKALLQALLGLELGGVLGRDRGREREREGKSKGQDQRDGWGWREGGSEWGGRE